MAEGPRIYRIPENFMDEHRILKGMLRTRYFVEGIAMAAAAAIPGLLLPVDDFTQRVPLLVFLCGVPFIIGVTGINGDPVSTTARNAWHWFRNRKVMLYDEDPTPLKATPLSALSEERRISDTVLERVEEVKASRKAKAEAEVYIKGVTFEFAEDPTLVDLYVETTGQADVEEQTEPDMVYISLEEEGVFD